MEPTGDSTPPTCIPDHVVLGSLHEPMPRGIMTFFGALSMVANAKAQGAVCLPGLLAGNWRPASTERGD